MNKEQVQQYLQCLDKEPLFYRTMVNLMVFTGLRRGEVVGLQWGDIDLEQKTVQVVRNVIRDTKSETGIYIGTPKTEDGVRTIALSSYLIGLLDGWREEQTARRGMLLPTAYVFSNAEDPYWPLYPTTVTAWGHDFAMKHDLPQSIATRFAAHSGYPGLAVRCEPENSAGYAGSCGFQDNGNLLHWYHQGNTPRNCGSSGDSGVWHIRTCATKSDLFIRQNSVLFI